MASIRRAVHFGGPADGSGVQAHIEPDESKEIEFRSLDPGAASAVGDSVLLCPVTRQELRPADRIYQCRVCRTSYSEAGWDFLRDVDKGRCCGCGMLKSVELLQGKRE